MKYLNTLTNSQNQSYNFSLIHVDETQINEVTFAHIRQALKEKVKVVLVYEGKREINELIAKYVKSEVEKGNVLIDIDKKVIESFVMEAYDNISSLINSVYLRGIPKNSFGRDSLPFYRDNTGKGRISGIEGIDFSVPINTLGFVGEQNGNYYQLNTHDIIDSIVKYYGHQINEILFISHDGAIFDKNNQPIPLVLKSNIFNINSNIRLSEGLGKQLENIEEKLDHVDKVVLTQGSNLSSVTNGREENGTVFVNDDKISVGGLKDKALFGKMFRRYVRKKIFRPRSSQEIEDLMKRHIVLSVGDTTLGGFSLKTVGRKSILLESFWVVYSGCGLGKIILQEAKNRVEETGKRLVLTSRCPIAGRFYEKNGFVDVGEFGKEENNETRYNNEIEDYLLNYFMGGSAPELTSRIYIYEPK